MNPKYPHMIDAVLLAARKKAAEAMLKYPAGVSLLGPSAKLSEEAGELIKACHKAAEGKGDLQDAYDEAVDTIAMVIRLVAEGDPNIKLPPLYESQKSFNQLCVEKAEEMLDELYTVSPINEANHG